MTIIRSLLAGLAVALLLAACSQDGAADADTAQTDTAQTDTSEAPALDEGGDPAAGGRTAADAPTAGDDGFSPLSSRDAAIADGTPLTAAGLAFTLPAGWENVPPSSRMRLAQARIPGPGGDADLTVFHFGVGGGGGVESNLQRWVGQVELDEDQPPIRDTFAAGELTVTWVDALGTLKPSTMGMGPTMPQPNSRLLGAVVEGPGGPWFFKATGPADTLAEARTGFIAMLENAQIVGSGRA